MARGSNTNNRVLVRSAGKALDQFKYEVAHELGVQGVDDGYWGDIPSRQCGAVGGHMVRKMIEMAEQNIAGRTH
ncbi:Small, acid-soluble spore protein alpha [Candidatus Hydrogenisulfobacillus filiaventi]|uniref:Small, acid-soluble spore protein alpha n=1 Tax=Candidatus Hydrogenisulfobacillus filiaventi TaxID=2707344 RepID=A0A6F8ZHA8_9FIRM|nr:alpha/beta-type small acid-soluble spore protein [Bacillota bacterium]CAB1129144.1 Small, acid-soluble spore protein alpha [Candidatus Hydrogenisulfobacillus filiaventi]